VPERLRRWDQRSAGANKEVTDIARSGCPPPPSSATDRFAQRESHVRAAHLDFGPFVFRLHLPPRLGCVLLFPLALPVSLPSLHVSRYASHLRSTRCAPNPLHCILRDWLRQRVINGTIWLSPQRLRVSTPTRLISFSPCMLLARPTAPPSHLSIPFPPLLHRVLSARARASAHERRACARANTRNNAVGKHRTRAKLLRARARPFK